MIALQNLSISSIQYSGKFFSGKGTSPDKEINTYGYEHSHKSVGLENNLHIEGTLSAMEFTKLNECLWSVFVNKPLFMTCM